MNEEKLNAIITNLQSINSQLKKSKGPILVELIGTPKSGKTTLLNHVSTLFENNNIPLVKRQETAEYNPISDKSADIVFVPKFGDNLKMAVNKENADVTIGNITKKMTPIVTLKLKRFLVPHLHQREYCDIQFNLKLQM